MKRLDEEASRRLELLVKALPEVYQPIHGHPEFDAQASRGCEQRLGMLLPVVEALRTDRPLRLLDIGCAQGFFSFALLQRGLVGEVVGIDIAPQNTALCQRLAEEAPGRCTFVTGQVSPEFIAEHGPFDVVLGLSVLHHVAHVEGPRRVLELLQAVARHSRVALLELALKSEGLYWAHALPQDPRAWLEAFPFTRELGRAGTHLTDHPRPLLLCSGREAWVGSRCFPFEEALLSSHEFEQGAHLGTRRYFLSQRAAVVTKRFEQGGPRGEANRVELRNERDVLERYGARLPQLPRLLAYEETPEALYLVRTTLPGVRLSQLIERGAPFEADQAIGAVLEQLVALEQQGLFHGDLRTWNVLFDEASGRWSLIDFGALMERPAEDAFEAFLAFCYAVLSRERPAYPQVLWPRRSPLAFPPAYRAMVDRVNGTPASELSFERVRQWLAGGADEAPRPEALGLKVDRLHGALERAVLAQLPWLTESTLQLRQQVGGQASATDAQLSALSQQLASQTQRLEQQAEQLSQLRQELAAVREQAREVSMRHEERLHARLEPLREAQARSEGRLQLLSTQLQTQVQSRLGEMGPRLEGLSRGMAELQQGVQLLREQVMPLVELKHRLRSLKPLYQALKRRSLL